MIGVVHATAELGDEAHEVEVIGDGDVEDEGGVVEETVVASKATVGPTGAAAPTQADLVDDLLREGGGFVLEVEVDAAEVAVSCS